MRLVLSCKLDRSPGNRHSAPSKDELVNIERLQAVIDSLSWGIRTKQDAEVGSAAVVSQVLDGLPTEIANRVRQSDLVALEPRIGVLGLASLERSRRITIRAISEDSAELESVAQSILERLPGAVAVVDSSLETEFDEEPEIRDRHTQNTIAIADLEGRRHLGFREFLRTERQRELSVLQWLSGLALVCFVAGLVISTRGLATADHHGHWNPWVTGLGYLERGATTFFIAMLTLLMNSTQSSTTAPG